MYIYGVTIFVRKRGDPEDWSVSADTSHSNLYCGVNVPDETGKMSRSDKRGRPCLRLPRPARGLAMTIKIILFCVGDNENAFADAEFEIQFAAA